MGRSFRSKFSRGLSTDALVGVGALVVILVLAGSVVAYSALKKTGEEPEQGKKAASAEKDTGQKEEAKKKPETKAPKKSSGPTPKKKEALKAVEKKVIVTPPPKKIVPPKPVAKPDTSKDKAAHFEKSVELQARILIDRLIAKLGRGAKGMGDAFWEKQLATYRKYARVQVHMWQDMMAEGKKMGLSKYQINKGIDRIDPIVEKGGFSDTGRVPMETILSTLKSCKRYSDPNKFGTGRGAR